MKEGAWDRLDWANTTFRELVIPLLPLVLPGPIQYRWIEGSEEEWEKHLDTQCGIDGYIFKPAPKNHHEGGWTASVSNKVREGVRNSWSVPVREADIYRLAIAEHHDLPSLQIQAWVDEDHTLVHHVGVGDVREIMAAIDGGLAFRVENCQNPFWDVSWSVVRPLYDVYRRCEVSAATG